MWRFLWINPISSISRQIIINKWLVKHPRATGTLYSPSNYFRKRQISNAYLQYQLTDYWEELIHIIECLKQAHEIVVMQWDPWLQDSLCHGWLRPTVSHQKGGFFAWVYFLFARLPHTLVSGSRPWPRILVTLAFEITDPDLPCM